MSDSAQRRPAGRILSIGFPLPGVRVDNYNICTAPSFFDYDALVVQASSVSELIQALLDGREDIETFAGAPVRINAGHPGDVTLASVLARRADETAALLERGGIVLDLAQPPRAYRIDEREPVRDDAWLGEHAPPLTTGDGNVIDISDAQHPLASFLFGQEANISYRAHIAAGDLPPDARVFARSYGGAAIAVDYPAGEGRVVVLPALKAIPSGDARYRLSDAFQAGIRRLLGLAGEGRSPGWVAGYPLAGLDERAAALQDTRERLHDATVAVEAAGARHEELERYRRLLWQEGRIGLDDAAIASLRLIGFDVYDADPDNLELRRGDTGILLEVEGSAGPIDMAPHYRLRQRLERALQRPGDVPRGLILINGYRHESPADRAPQATDALRGAAAQMGYAVCPTTLLFEAVAGVLAGDETAAVALRDRLATEAGLIS